MSYGGAEPVTFYIEQEHVGRIIGKGGVRIREIQDDSSCQIKIESRNCEVQGKARVDLTGSTDQQSEARSIIDKIIKESQEGGGRGGRGGGGGYGGRREGGYGGGGGREGGYGGGREGGYGGGGGRDGGYGGGRYGGGGGGRDNYSGGGQGGW